MTVEFTKNASFQYNWCICGNNQINAALEHSTWWEGTHSLTHLLRSKWFSVLSVLFVIGTSILSCDFPFRSMTTPLVMSIPADDCWSESSASDTGWLTTTSNFAPGRYWLLPTSSVVWHWAWMRKGLGKMVCSMLQNSSCSLVSSCRKSLTNRSEQHQHCKQRAYQTLGCVALGGVFVVDTCYRAQSYHIPVQLSDERATLPVVS